MIEKIKGNKLVKCMYDTREDIMALYEVTDEGKNVERYIKKPKIEFYISKPEYYQDYNMDYLDLDKVRLVKAQYSNLLETIALELDKLESEVFKEETTRHMDFYKKNKGSRGCNILLTSPNIFGADMHIEDFYIMKYNEKYDYSTRIRKGFFDIETNIYYAEKHNNTGMKVDQNNALAPIYLITYKNPEDIFYTFILDDGVVPASRKFIDDTEGFQAYTNEKQKEFPHLKFEFVICESEIELIKAFYERLHIDNPEYLMAWNIEFDLLTLHNRIKILGYNLEDIIIPSDIPLKRTFYFVDHKAMDFSDNSSYYIDNSRTKFMCQMLVYCKFRKTAAKPIGGYTLDSISSEELGERKVMLDDSSIARIAYDNYKKFLDYSIKDTVLLDFLEKKVKDIDRIHLMSKITNTRYYKVQAKSLAAKNEAYMNFKEESGVIVSNNLNVEYGQGLTPTNGFEGAFVADPELNGYNGVYILGKRSKYLQGRTIDFDYSSMYPNIMRSFQIARQNSRGTIIATLAEQDATREFTDLIACKEYYQLARKFLGMSDLTTIIKKVQERMGDDI